MNCFFCQKKITILEILSGKHKGLYLPKSATYSVKMGNAHKKCFIKEMKETRKELEKERRKWK